MSESDSAIERVMIVFGGRSHAPSVDHRKRFARELIKFDPSVVFHGGATGADRWMSQIAFICGYRVVAFPVTKSDWDRHGGKAGPMRNSLMLKEAQVAVPPADILGVHVSGANGTADMRRKLEARGIDVIDLEKP